MTGAEFWIYVVVVVLTVWAAVRVFVAAWRDHDDDLSTIDRHRRLLDALGTATEVQR